MRARIRIAEQLRGGVEVFRDQAAWHLTKDRDDIWFVCTEESYRHQPAHLLDLRKLADSSTATTASSYTPLRRLPTYPALSPAEWNPIAADVSRVFAEVAGRTDPDAEVEFWSAYSTTLTAAPAPVLANQVQGLFEQIVLGFPHAALWLVGADSKIAARQAAVRALFATASAPEVINRPDHERAEGLPAAKGLISPAALASNNYIEPAFLVTAPWILGNISGRLGGSIATILGGARAGRRPGRSAELIQLMRPRLLSHLEPSTAAAPTVTTSGVEALLRWWVAGVNLILAALLDPANFTDSSGDHDAPGHYGMILSVDRLFACVQSVLFGSRRDDFTRKVMMFDSIDLLQGMGVDKSNREKLLSHRHLNDEMDMLSRRLPPEVWAIAGPRCQAAVDALKSVQDGFYLYERIKDAQLELPTKGGGVVRYSLDRAAAMYLGVVRNSGHSFSETVRSNPQAVALLAAHTGDLADELADIAFLHLLRVLNDPTLLFPKLRAARFKQL